MKNEKLKKLKEIIGGYGKILIAFSGGVDSSFLVKVAHDVLGSNAFALTAVSPTYTPEENDTAREFCKDLGIKHIIKNTDEMANPHFASNPPERCYFCKKELFEVCRKEAKALGIDIIATADNVDDLDDYRPGLKAVKDLGVKTPMIEAGLTKAEVRELSKDMNLPTWDRESIACLASRIPYGTSISGEVLNRIARIEKGLRLIGLKGVRARYHDDNLVRIEVRPKDIASATDEVRRDKIINLCKAEGFKFVTLDLEGYRMGSFNSLLAVSDTPIK